MNSPGHRANILKPAYREIGIGIVAGNPARTDGAGATYATTFGVIEASDRRGRPQAPRAAARRKAAKAAKAARKRKRAKRRGSRAKVARKATASRHHGRGKGERRARKRRGPTARISV